MLLPSKSSSFAGPVARPANVSSDDHDTKNHDFQDEPPPAPSFLLSTRIVWTMLRLRRVAPTAARLALVLILIWIFPDMQVMRRDPNDIVVV